MTDVAESTTEQATLNLRWYQGVPRYAWVVLMLAALGWMFDTFDQHLFTLLRNPSLRDILGQTITDPKALDAAITKVGGNLTSVFLLGWAAGGFLFGMVGDKLGRTRTMVTTILIYAVFTGLNGLARSPLEYGICRFLIALGVGGEFAAGASLVAEVWPNRSRPMALGLVQALSAVGNVCAALTTLVLASVSWRWIFAVGAAPALLVFWIMLSVKEPEKWQEAKRESEGGGRQLGSISALFADPILRRNTFVGVSLAAAGVAGAWGAAFFSPDLISGAFRPMVQATAATKAELDRGLQMWRSWVFLVQMCGAGLGMFSYALLSERIGRKKAMAIVFVAAFLSLEAFFGLVRTPATAFPLAFLLGFCALAPFSAYMVYFPELYPTRVRATGIGFCYNSARVLAAAAPFTLGTLSRIFADPADPTAGLRKAAAVVACVYVVGLIALLFAPETQGKPLPE